MNEEEWCRNLLYLCDLIKRIIDMNSRGRVTNNDPLGREKKFQTSNNLMKEIWTEYGKVSIVTSATIHADYVVLRRVARVGWRCVG